MSVMLLKEIMIYIYLGKASLLANLYLQLPTVLGDFSFFENRHRREIQLLDRLSFSHII